jgi:hypothetical protein
MNDIMTIRVQVVDVQVTNSIADKKNIFVLVPMDVDKSRLRTRRQTRLDVLRIRAAPRLAHRRLRGIWRAWASA